MISETESSAVREHSLDWNYRKDHDRDNGHGKDVGGGGMEAGCPLACQVSAK